VQDALAIAVAVLTGAWLVWSLTRRLARPSCGPPPSTPAGSDGFVPLDDLARTKQKKSGRPAGRPDR
jgi:hypothetical protein